jgi:hypothetical protein
MTPNQAAAPENNPYRQSYAPTKTHSPKERVLKAARAIPQKPIKSGWQKKRTSLLKPTCKNRSTDTENAVYKVSHYATLMQLCSSRQ